MEYKAAFIIMAAMAAFSSADIGHLNVGHTAPVHHAAPIAHAAPIPHATPVPHGQVGYGYEEPVYGNVPAHSNFEYAVHDDYAGTNFGHSEARDGYRTEGTYYVHLPDGRVQTVSYYADETGYHPTVSYEGTASYGAPAAAYHAPEVGYH